MTDIHHKKAKQAIKKAERNRDKARQKLLQQREKLAERRKENRQQSERTQNRDNDSMNKNPSVYSTVPKQKTNEQNAVRNAHSTVPTAPQYSQIPPSERLFGLRFYQRKQSSDSNDGK
jgi:seryl-tRNA synthetase